ncbi:hypothetical protein BD626DRAFT_627457 [Schizophyllum amplum]|uniref:DUF6535 domain-containing protein n=1 Tax=Schizophyllum amplum TaxID=97359 RepID=A0A550CQG8_9AGAR|nr:hypothetical protein BD626DRAFT_627457 [Auriculariopsis ampla]
MGGSGWIGGCSAGRDFPLRPVDSTHILIESRFDMRCRRVLGVSPTSLFPHHRPRFAISAAMVMASSLFRKFLHICYSPFRGITPDLDGSWATRVNGSSDGTFHTKRENASSIFTDNTRASMSKDGATSPQNTPWHIGDKEFHNKPAGENTAWQECSKLVDTHDTTMCQVWGGEVDTLLVFAGLFSAVLTAFIIEAYKWLLEEPDDLTADYLRQILAIMSNTTIPSVPRSSSRPSLPDDVVALINGLWFSSLTLSLSSALIGIVSKQWLREYLRDVGRTHETNLSIRQVKYEGLTRWYVGAIITTIPLLLQTALFLFLVGIVYLLWHLQPTVAAIISVLGIFVVFFFIATTILPALQFILYQSGRLRLHTTSQFPYKSAQAWLFLRTLIMAINFLAWLYHSISRITIRVITMKGKSWQPFVAPYPTYPAWPQLDIEWTRRRDESAQWSHEPTSIGRCLGFIELNFEHHLLRDWLWNCVWSMRQNPTNAKHVLQCVRRTPKIKPDFPASTDILACAVAPLLDPRTETQATSELVSHMLVDSKSEAYVEHLIRIYNSLVRRGVQEVPDIVFESLRTTLRTMPGGCSQDTRLQLFLVAKDILRRSQHTESIYSTFLDTISIIVSRLSRSEVQERYGFTVEELSLDLSSEIMDWLGRYPDPSSNWRDYKSRVLWSAKTAILLARRLSLFEPLDTIATWHPRLPSVYALLEFVHNKVHLIPVATLPTWTPENFTMEEFVKVKKALEAICDAASESDIEVPQRLPQRLPTPQVPSAGSKQNKSRLKISKRHGARQNLRWDEGAAIGERALHTYVPESDIADVDLQTTEDQDNILSKDPFATLPIHLNPPSTLKAGETGCFNNQDSTDTSGIEAALGSGPVARSSLVAAEECDPGFTSVTRVGSSRDGPGEGALDGNGRADDRAAHPSHEAQGSRQTQTRDDCVRTLGST